MATGVFADFLHRSLARLTKGDVWRVRRARHIGQSRRSLELKEGNDRRLKRSHWNGWTHGIGLVSVAAMTMAGATLSFAGRKAVSLRVTS
jgi:hypothetical protein